MKLRHYVAVFFGLVVLSSCKTSLSEVQSTRDSSQESIDKKIKNGRIETKNIHNEMYFNFFLEGETEPSVYINSALLERDGKSLEVFIKHIGQAGAQFRHPDPRLLGKGIAGRLVSEMVDHYRQSDPRYSAELAHSNLAAVLLPVIAYRKEGRIISSITEFDAYAREKALSNDEVIEKTMFTPDAIKENNNALKTKIEEIMIASIKYSPLARLLARHRYSKISDPKIEWLFANSTERMRATVAYVVFEKEDRWLVLVSHFVLAQFSHAQLNVLDALI